jgi:hypothetical protein
LTALLSRRLVEGIGIPIRICLEPCLWQNEWTKLEQEGYETDDQQEWLEHAGWKEGDSTYRSVETREVEECPILLNC